MGKQIGAEGNVRKELEAAYASNVDAFKTNDVAYLERVFASDFEATDFNGETHDRQMVMNYIRHNAGTLEVLALSMDIVEFTIRDSRAIVMVEQKSSKTLTDDEGELHQLDVGVVQQEVWVKDSEGWKLQRVEEKELLYAFKDGESMVQ